MTTNETIRFGTIGFGIMGERLLSAALTYDEDQLTVAGAWDPAVDARVRLQRDYPQATAFDEIGEIFEACDCVHVASPPGFHLQQLEAAVDAGLAVLCEKPLAVNVEEARATLSRLEAKNARAGVNFPFTSSFAVDQLGAWREEGAVGDLQSLDIEIAFAAWPRPWQEDAVSWLSKRMEGGFTREVVSHFLFLTMRQIGPIILQSHSADYPSGDACETSISATLQAGGIPVSLSARVGGTDKPDHNLWTLKGTKGSIRLRDWAVAERLGADGQWAEAPGSRSNEEMRPLVLKRQLDKVVAMARGEPHTLATLLEAFQVQELVETILES